MAANQKILSEFIMMVKDPHPVGSALNGTGCMLQASTVGPPEAEHSIWLYKYPWKLRGSVHVLTAPADV